MKYWRAKLTLFLNYFIFGILLNSVGIVILQVQNSYGVSASSASVLEAFKDISIAVTSFLVASYIVRIGYRNSMLFALGVIALASLVMPMAPSFLASKLMFLVTGVCFALVKVSVFAALGLFAHDRREHVSLMNFLEFFFMVGVLSGYFLFSAFVDDANPGGLGWLKVYYALSGLAAVAFVLLLFTDLHETTDAESSQRSSAGGHSEFIAMLQLTARPLVLVFIFSAFLYVLLEQSVMTWLPTFNSRVLHLSTSLSIQMTSILALSTAVGRLLAAFLFRRLDWFPVLFTCLLCAGALVLVTLPMTAGEAPAEVVSNWAAAPVAAFLFPLLGLCIAPVYPAINAVILSALPRSQHASMAGLIVVFSALGGSAGSIVTGTLFEHVGGRLAFYGSLLPLALLLLTLYGFRRLLATDGAGKAASAPTIQ